MDEMGLKWGLIGGCAILMFAELYDPPIVSRAGAAEQEPGPGLGLGFVFGAQGWKEKEWGPLLWRGSTRAIDIIIQPWEKVCAVDVNEWLCSGNGRFAQDFRAKPGFGPKKPQIILRIPSENQDLNDGTGVNTTSFVIKRGPQKKAPGLGIGEKLDPKTGIKYKELLIDLNIYDHYTCPSLRSSYDLRLPQNNRFVQTLPSSPFPRQKIYLLNAAWLLKQKIKLWNERERKFDDWNDVKTLIEVLQRQGNKLVLREEEDREELVKLVSRSQGDPTSNLRQAIVCPEVLGPWWEVGWVRGLLGVVLVFVVLLVNEELSSEY
jgi:hypothetical protein